MLRSLAVVGFFGLSGLFGLFACSKDKAAEAPPPTCAQIAEHMHQLAVKEYPGAAQLGNPKSYIEGCEARSFTPAERRCMAKAPTMKALAKCRPSDEKPAAP